MTWFNILFCVVFAIFFLKTLISWIAGDVDVDVDFDGETDVDVSGMLSFKGILHFLMGFSTVLTTIGYVNTHSFTVPYAFPISTYVFAVCFGIFIMVLLFYLYKFMLKLNHFTNNNPNLDSMTAKIYLIEDGGQYQVLVDTPSGTFKKIAYSDIKKHKIGEEVVIKWDKESNRYIFN